MNISANTLFHFTPKEEYLISILRNGFIPRYCLESNFIITDDVKRWAIPMVCFCDIPLGNTKEHMNKYGDFGIGMTKEWGVKNGLTPILYTTTNSQLSKSLKHQRNEIINLLLEKNIPDIYDRNLYTSFFIKEYEGYYNKSKIHDKLIRFYDEREWRYVPSKMEFENESFIPMISQDIFENEIKLEKHNNKLSTCNLVFDVSDIKYIIVPTENILESFLLKLEQNRIVEKAIKLATKIISFERIYSDF